jgi:hypothetical protein
MLSLPGVLMYASAPLSSMLALVSISPGPPLMLCVVKSRRRTEPSRFNWSV